MDDEIAAMPRRHTVRFKPVAFVERHIRLSDDVLVFLFRVKIFDLRFGNLSFAHRTIGRFDEPKLVDTGVHAQRRDQPDVRPFRSFDRA